MTEIKVFKEIIGYKLDPKAIKQCIGENIRKRRKEMNLSQEELAEKSRVSRPVIVNIEKGNQGTPVHKLYLIAFVLECEPQELMPKMQTP